MASFLSRIKVLARCTCTWAPGGTVLYSVHSASAQSRRKLRRLKAESAGHATARDAPKGLTKCNKSAQAEASSAAAPTCPAKQPDLFASSRRAFHTPCTGQLRLPTPVPGPGPPGWLGACSPPSADASQCPRLRPARLAAPSHCMPLPPWPP